MSDLEKAIEEMIDRKVEQPKVTPGRKRLQQTWAAGRETRWIREMYFNSRKSAERRNVPFQLSRVEFNALVARSRGECMLTGIPFEFEHFKESCRRPFAPSLDRISSGKGYTPDNCRLVCVIVNLALNEWGIEPLIRVAEALVQRGGQKAA